MKNKKKIEEWLNQRCTVDIYGRQPGLADVPLTTMTLEKVLFKRHSWKDIQAGEKELQEDHKMPEGTIEFLAKKRKLELANQIMEKI